MREAARAVAYFLRLVIPKPPFLRLRNPYWPKTAWVQ